MAANIDALLAAHPIEIYQACDSLFTDQEWLSWEPETILLELKHEVSDASIDKLLAVQAVAANADAVLKSAAAFEKVVNAFSNNICVMDVVQPPEVEEMSYSVSQIEKIIHEVHGSGCTVTYSGEVPPYVASVAQFRGWAFLPKNLSFAQERLEYLSGMQADTKIRKENQNILDVISSVVQDTTRGDARTILEDESITALEKDDTASLLVKRLLGALLYDPTLPYRTTKDAREAHKDDSSNDTDGKNDQ